MKKIQKMIKRLLILLLVCYNLQADKVDVTLREFANIVATQNNINILISSDIEDNNILFIIADKKNSIFLPAFEKMLSLKGLTLFKNKGFYYIDKNLIVKDIEILKEFYTIDLKNLVYDDINALLLLNDIKSVYIKTTNSIGFFATPMLYKELKEKINIFDVAFPQIQFKINIFYTNIDDLKERGFNLSAYAKSVEIESSDSSTSSIPFTYFLNLITMPYNAPSNILDTSKKGFYGVVKYLNQNGYTKIENSPILTAKSHSKVSFSSVKNVPYKTSSITNENTTQSTTENIEYKDVGLKIELFPIVLNDVINFDLNLIVEEIVTSSITPTTEKRQLNSTYSLKRGEILVLSGVNKESTLSSDYGIPLLKEIWFLGNLFKYKSETINKSVLTITIEVL